MDIVFATNNQHKVSEVSALIAPLFSILTLKEIGCHEDIPETADTLEGNALLKAQFVYQKFKCNCFADDTGLEVEALGGAPGVFSARYAGEHGDAEANMKKLLQSMEGMNNRAARFRTVIALIIEGKEYLFEGVIEGSIALSKSGQAGFGYDPIFIPKGYDMSFAELGDELKNRISHRALATEKLCQWLRDNPIRS